MKRLVVTGLLALSLSASLAGCGRMADLEAPPARKTERGMRDAHAEPLPDPATINRPPSQIPIDGGPSSNPYDGPGSPR